MSRTGRGGRAERAGAAERAERAGRAQTVSRAGWAGRAGRAGAGKIVLAVAVLGTLATLGVLAALIIPGYTSLAARFVADGNEPVRIPDSDVSLIPAAEWTVRPEPNGDGILLHSPDGVLTVRAEAGVQGDGLAAAADGSDSAEAILHETLGNGMALTHETVGEGFRGELTPGAGASGASGSSGSAGDPAVSAIPEVRVTVTAEVAEGAELDPYRPALSELLESASVDLGTESAAH